MGSSPMLRFDGRVAVVTGGGRGLGRAHCLLLAARGAKVLVNNRTAEKADEVVAEITAAGGVAAADYHDVASAGAAVVEHALQLWGRVDIVIANAGQLEDGTFAKMPVENFTALLDTHVVGHFNVVKAAWPHFREQGYGRIVVISSESGLHGNFGQTNYSAAKGALMGMGQTWAMEGYKYGIICNVICTEGNTRMMNNLLPEEQRLSEQELAAVPQPAAVPVVYLAHESTKATAGIFRVDGGHVQSYRWQVDEQFVDFNPDDVEGGLESVASQWPTLARWETVSYRGQDRHAASPIGARAKL